MPNTAITASPMNFSTVPPYSEIRRRHVSKYRESSSRTSSASRDSLSEVNPTRSANRTVTKRRSDEGAAAAVRAGGPSSPAPHSSQNSASGGTGWPLGQTRDRGEPHWRQNLALARLPAPQTAQVMTGMSVAEGTGVVQSTGS